MILLWKQLLNFGHGKLKNIMESHGIWKLEKSTNPAVEHTEEKPYKPTSYSLALYTRSVLTSEPAQVKPNSDVSNYEEQYVNITLLVFPYWR